MSTLYRKYRPKLWSEVYGQEVIKNTLKNEILNDNLAHAYIFAGPRGIGKTTIARLFAKTLNCKNRKAGEIEPCCECESCLSINNGSNMNVIEIDAASNTGIDDVRELRKLVRIPPETGCYKVFIIDEVHMLSKAAFNALLKTLEEPPERVIFILATTEINKVLDTILSRCQIFKFKKATNTEIIDTLKSICQKEQMDIDDEVLNKIAQKAAGGFRDAESLLGQIISSSDKRTITIGDVDNVINNINQDYILNFVNSLVKSDTKSCLDIINTVIENQINFDDFTLNLIETFRKILIYKYNPDCIDNWKNLTEDASNTIKSISKEIDFNKLSNIIKKLIQVKLDSKDCDIIQLPLEIAVVELSNIEANTKQIPEQKSNTKVSDYKVTKKETATPEKVTQDTKVSQPVTSTTRSNDDVSVFDILDEEEERPKLSDIVEKNGLLNHTDPKKRAEMMKRFGLTSDGSVSKDNKAATQESAPTDNIEIGSDNNTAQTTQEPAQEDVSVMDLLKDEFMDNLE